MLSSEETSDVSCNGRISSDVSSNKGSNDVSLECVGIADELMKSWANSSKARSIGTGAPTTAWSDIVEKEIGQGSTLGFLEEKRACSKCER